jgi:hypothetical protein
MRILLDADTLLEYILNRSMFIHEVENLEEMGRNLRRDKKQ